MRSKREDLPRLTVHLDYANLDALLAHHPAWRLLRSDHAPLVVSFLHRVFVAPNVRTMSGAALTESLEDELFSLRERLGDGAFPKQAIDYLNDWASRDKGWLRKFYRMGEDEPHFDLTPASEKAIAWLGTLTQRSFVGTESRLMTLFDLLKQMSEGSETDPAKRIHELRKRRDDIDAEIAQIERGDVPVMDETALRERFLQFTQAARELLGDFREVEQNFRLLDRSVRERIARWEQTKGALLQEIMGERDLIADSDQGRSFRAFWEFLMSSTRQETLSALLDRVLTLPAVVALSPDTRLRRVHYDWLEAGEHTQRTVAQLSHQLRRFLDDKAWFENRRIMDILRSIETSALAVRETPPPATMAFIDASAAEIELALERPLYAPKMETVLKEVDLRTDDVPIDLSALYSQVIVDRARLSRHLRHALQLREAVTLAELIEQQPLTHGLAEIVAYLQMGLGGGDFRARIDEAVSEHLSWQGLDSSGKNTTRRVTLARVVFMR